MFRLGLNDEIPYNEFAGYLEEGNMIYVDEEMLKKAIVTLEHQAQSRFQQLSTTIYGVTAIKLSHITRQHIIDYLIDYGVPEKFFCKQGSSSPIYYNQKVKNKIIQNGYICDAFLLYEDYKKKTKLLSNIRNILDRSQFKPRAEGNFGQALIPIDYKVVPTKNRRFSTKEENTIGFYDQAQAAFSSPDDYYILSADFPQIDAKAALNLYMKNGHLVEMMKNIDDTYLLFKEYSRYIEHELDKKELEKYNGKNYYVPLEELERRINAYRSDILPFPSIDTRNIYKVTALKAAYYGRHSVFEEEQRTLTRLGRMYESSERYHRILDIVKKMYNYNIPIEVSSRWGHKRVIIEHDMRATLSSVFNAPIQTTSSEVIIAYVVEFLKYFRDKGLGPDAVRICLNRHDEPIFYIRKDVFEEHLGFINSMRVILVDGWLPFELQMYVGYSYKKNDPHPHGLLERYKTDLDRAMLESEKHIKDEEPYPLTEPLFVYLVGLKAPDNTMRTAFLWHDGELPKDLSLTKEYVDRRRLNIKLLSFSTEENIMTHHLIESITDEFCKLIKTNKTVVVLAANASNTDTLLSTTMAHFRSDGETDLHVLGRGALLASIKREYPEHITAYDEELISYLEQNKEMFTR